MKDIEYKLDWIYAQKSNIQSKFKKQVTGLDFQIYMLEDFL